MLGTPPSYTQITESFSVNLLARPYTIFLVIGDAHNAAAVNDGNCTDFRWGCREQDSLKMPGSLCCHFCRKTIATLRS